MSISVKQNNTYATATGVWVKVNGVWKQVASEGLPGIGGWATITAVSGVYTPHRYNDGPDGVGGTDWVAYEWTDDGTLTTQSGGLVDALLVSGGGTGYTDDGSGKRVSGTAGRVNTGLLDIGLNHNIVVGAGGVANVNSAQSGHSEIVGVVSVGGVSYGDSRNGAGSVTTHDRKGIVSRITGEDYEYGRGGEAAGGPGTTYGQPASEPGFTARYDGYQGVVIVRVPAAYADGVAENFHGWDSFALVNDGVVTDVTKVPDNEPHTLDAEWLPCPAEVQPGWDHTDGEFTPPPAPTRDDLIAELKDQIKDLQKDK